MDRALTDRVLMGGVGLACEVSGSGEPVVFIHGAFIADAFRPLFSESGLSGRFRLIAYRRRGYAGSSAAAGRVEPERVAREAADCRALLRHLGVARAHVVGHSFGGAVALQLALDSPEVVQSLALLEPALMVGESAEGYRASLARGVARYREVGAEVAVDEFLRARWPDYRAALERVLPGGFARAVADAGTSFEWELPGLLAWRFGVEEARRVDRPVLSVLGGASDALSPRFGEVHRLLLAWLPQAEGVVLPGVSHFMQLEDSGGTAGALAAFWARHPLPAGFT